MLRVIQAAAKLDERIAKSLNRLDERAKLLAARQRLSAELDTVLSQPAHSQRRRQQIEDDIRSMSDSLESITAEGWQV